MDDALRFLLEDMRDDLIATEWGGVLQARQCPRCGRRIETRPKRRHNNGCTGDELLRRIDAFLGGE